MGSIASRDHRPIERRLAPGARLVAQQAKSARTRVRHVALSTACSDDDLAGHRTICCKVATPTTTSEAEGAHAAFLKFP
jgi:hypothetical protein